ncbi:MAG: ABC transporter permease [Verrucomicrobiales bacterium]|nr:ABC transporter permease [Verrucomicrobiales bacterium]
MRMLCRKELRSIRPFLLLILGFGLLDPLFVLFAHYPDQADLSEWLEAETQWEAHLMMFFFAIALAVGLLVREQDEGTLAFLDALPVSRDRVFVAKILVASGVLCLYPCLNVASAAVFHALSRTSLETTFPWRLLLAGGALQVAAGFFWFSLGLSLSFLRRFAFLVLALLFWAALALEEAGWTPIRWINVFSLAQPTFLGRTWVFPREKLLVQAAVATAFLALAWWRFRRLGEAVGDGRFLALRRRPWWTVLIVTGATMVTVVAWIGLLVWFGKDLSDSLPGSVSYPQWRPSRATTERYEFIFPEYQIGTMAPLLEAADGVEAKVRGFLGGEDSARIRVDLTSPLERHAGLAYWKSVRLSSRMQPGDPETLAVLGHETVHVRLDQLSAGRLSDVFPSMRLFHEGVATYVEHRFFATNEPLAQSRRVAAVTRARDEVKVEELVDSDLLRKRRDPDLVYPLGEVFIAALVTRHGDDAPARVARALARPSAPKDLVGLPLWQDAFQAAGCSWPGVVDEFFAELDRLKSEHREWVASIPRLRGIFVKDADRLGVRVANPWPTQGFVVCRFRASPEADPRFYESPTPSGDTFWVDRSNYPAATLGFQVGIRRFDASQVIYEPWVEVRL